MAVSTPTCGICDLRHIQKPSEVWCSECDEGLCGDCKEYHGLAKTSRNHKTVQIDEYRRLPADIINIKDHCVQHNETLVLFCQKHNFPCCRLCLVQDHDGCKKVPIEAVVHNVKTSSSFTETELLIEEILETMKEISKDRRSNVNSFSQQKKKIEQKIRETRVKVNVHLDKLEEALKKELSTAETRIITKTNQLIASIDKQKEEVVGYQTTLTNLKKYASDLQTFCALHQIQDEINTKDQYLRSLIGNGNLDRNHVSLKTNSMTDEVLCGIQFGEVIMESRPSEIKFTRRKEKEAQMMVVTMPTKSIDNILVVLRQKISTKLYNVTGCLLLPNDTMAFTCYRQNVVRIINKDGSKLFDITTRTSTFDMVYIEDSNSIAVTSYDCVGSITMIDNDSKHIQTTIPVKSYNGGITVRDDTLYFCAGNKGLRMVNLRDNSEHDVLTRPLSWDTYITTFNDKLYFTDNDRHTMTCCDLQGRIQWEFKDNGILMYPLGIDVDRDGNIYVVGRSTQNVVVISPDGKHCTQLLSQEDGLNLPVVLKFDKIKSKLLVSNEKNNAVLFDISY